VPIAEVDPDILNVGFGGGDVVRFEDNDLHGFENTSEFEFEYLSVTSPAMNFRGAYAGKWELVDT